MTTNPSPTTDAPEPARTPSADRWELPTEPEPGTVVQGRNYAWTHRKNGGDWRRTGSNQAHDWTTVLADAPLTRLVPAGQAPDAEREETVDRLIRVNDTLRSHLARYRGTPPLRDAAKALVMAETYDPSDKFRGALVDKLRAALTSVDAVDGRAHRTVTYDADQAPQPAEPDPDRAERRRKALRSRVVYEARRLLDSVDGGMPADDVDGPIVQLRHALARLDAATPFGGTES